MIIVLLLLNSGSFPPLPDISNIFLPEPVLWIQPDERGFLLNAYAGEFYGAGLDLDLNTFRARGQFVRENEWDSTELGIAQAAAKFTLPRLWIEPNFTFQRLRRLDEYTRLAPALDLTIFTSRIVTHGVFEYSHWLINSETSREATGTVSLTFDRMTTCPIITLHGIYSEENVKPSLVGRLHFGAFRLELGSAIVTSFPSPILHITYANPMIHATAGFRSGIKHSTLADYLDPELPVRYETPIPAETIRVSANLDLTLRIKDQSIAVSGAYKEWLARLNIIGDFAVSLMREIKETNLALRAHNKIRLGQFNLYNVLHLQYTDSDSALTFLPDISVTDTLGLTMGGLELSAGVRYFSERTGTSKTLPRQLLVNTQAGFRFYFMKVYFLIQNISDERSEIYDDRFLTGRQYAAGLEIKQSF